MKMKFAWIGALAIGLLVGGPLVTHTSAASGGKGSKGPGRVYRVAQRAAHHLIRSGRERIDTFHAIRNLSSRNSMTILNVEILDLGTGQNVADLNGTGCPFNPNSQNDAVVFPLPFELSPMGQGISNISFGAAECIGIPRFTNGLTNFNNGPNDESRRGGLLVVFTVQARNKKQIGGGVGQNRRERPGNLLLGTKALPSVILPD